MESVRAGRGTRGALPQTNPEPVPGSDSTLKLSPLTVQNFLLKRCQVIPTVLGFYWPLLAHTRTWNSWPFSLLSHLPMSVDTHRALLFLQTSQHWDHLSAAEPGRQSLKFSPKLNNMLVISKHKAQKSLEEIRCWHVQFLIKMSCLFIKMTNSIWRRLSVTVFLKVMKFC